MTEQIVLGCVPCAKAAQIGWTPYKDSTVAKCLRCHEDVWLGPEQKKQREAHGYTILCLICAIKEMGPQEALDSLFQLTDKKAGE